MRVQLVKRGDNVYLRAEPKTAKEPTIGQIKSRIAFGEIAKKAKGRKFTGELPPAAELVKQEMKGKEFGRTRKLRKWEEILLREAKEQGNEKMCMKILRGEIKI